MISNIKIPVYKPLVAKNQLKYVTDCIESNMLTFRGKYVSLLEEKLAEHLGIKYVTLTFNGSVSLNLMMHCLGIGPGDEVITPSLTYAATVSQINLLGAKAILTDSDNNLQINIEDLKDNITEKTKAVLIPELYADAPDLKLIAKICEDKNILFLEDSAEAFNCLIGKQHIGTFGKASSFSFFSNKVITFSEGGAVCTNDDALIDKMKLFKSQNHIGNFQHCGPGTNFRITNIQAAIGLAQLEELNWILERKQFIAKYYRDNLPETIIRLIPKVSYSSEWMPVFELPKEKINYERFSQEMILNYGIETRPIFTPIHLMPNFNIRKSKNLSNAETVYKNKFNLPSYPELTKKDLDYIVKSAEKVLNSPI